MSETVVAELPVVDGVILDVDAVSDGITRSSLSTAIMVYVALALYRILVCGVN